MSDLPGTIPEMFARNVRDFPQREALVALHYGSNSWVRHTWLELDQITNRVAAGYFSHGVRKGSKVAFMQSNCAECIYSYLALHKIGANFIPINVMLVAREVEYLFRNSGAEYVVIGESFTNLFQSIVSDFRDLKRVFCITRDGMSLPVARAVSFQMLIDAGDKPPITEIFSDDAADILYTSGTTGQPKGVVLTHGNKVANGRLAGAATDFIRSHYSHERYQYSFPFFTSATVSTVLMPWLYYGYTSIQAPRFEVELFLQIMQREKSTHCAAAPSMLNFILDHPKLNEYDTSLLRGVIYGGSAMPEDLVARIFKQWPRITTFDLYGLTEAGPGGTRLRMVSSDRSKSGSIGTAWPPDQEVRIVDPEGRDVKVREIGEIVIKGPNVMQGYHNNEKATAEAFIGEWLKTGDLGYYDEDGYFFYTDRCKDMIVRGGFNVYPVEVENALYEHPGVKQCAVLGKPHPKLGEDVFAMVVLREGYAADSDELIRFCEDKLATYKRPRELHIVEQLPLTAMGKLNKKELRKILAAQAGQTGGKNA